MLPAALFLITFGVALALTVDDFRNIARHPRQVFIGLGAQILLLPIIAFLIAAVWPMPPAFKVGLIIIAACPGGTTANLVNHLLRGHVALSLSITALNSIIILLTIPLIVNLGLEFFMAQHSELSLPVGYTLREIFLVVLLPTALGVFLRTRFPQTCQRLEPPLRYIMPAILGFVFLGAVLFDNAEGAEAAGSGTLSTVLQYVGLFPVALLLNLGSIAGAYYSTHALGIKKRSARTIAIEVGLQNTALAILVASKLLGSPEMARVALVYGSFTIFTTAGAGWLLKKYA